MQRYACLSDDDDDTTSNTNDNDNDSDTHSDDGDGDDAGNGHGHGHGTADHHEPSYPEPSADRGHALASPPRPAPAATLMFTRPPGPTAATGGAAHPCGAWQRDAGTRAATAPASAPAVEMPSEIAVRLLRYPNARATWRLPHDGGREAFLTEDGHAFGDPTKLARTLYLRCGSRRERIRGWDEVEGYHPVERQWVVLRVIRQAVRLSRPKDAWSPRMRIRRVRGPKRVAAAAAAAGRRVPDREGAPPADRDPDACPLAVPDASSLVGADNGSCMDVSPDPLYKVGGGGCGDIDACAPLSPDTAAAAADTAREQCIARVLARLRALPAHELPRVERLLGALYGTQVDVTAANPTPTPPAGDGFDVFTCPADMYTGLTACAHAGASGDGAYQHPDEVCRFMDHLMEELRV